MRIFPIYHSLEHVFRFLVVILSYLTPPADPSACVKYWQRQLNLQDWKITVNIVDGNTLDYGTLGDIELKSETKTAVMRIRRESESDLRGRLAQSEQRNTILHEMVHLRKFANNDPQWFKECAVDLEVDQLIRKHRRWFEMLAHER
jgi:hypothetical protein